MLTCYPSPTPFGLSLGSTNPTRINLASAEANPVDVMVTCAPTPPVTGSILTTGLTVKFLSVTSEPLVTSPDASIARAPLAERGAAKLVVQVPFSSAEMPLLTIDPS